MANRAGEAVAKLKDEDGKWRWKFNEGLDTPLLTGSVAVQETYIITHLS
jgi:hypothetical protein